MATEFVVYIRVSTEHQGADGLGMQSQQAICEAFANSRGAAIVETFSDVQSGADEDRPGLAAAIKNCRAFGRFLLVAKQDRLTRDLHHLTGIKKRVRVVCADMPDADDFMSNMWGCWAQNERVQISKRTKAALAVLKSNGVQLGNPKLAETARPLAALAISRKADATAARILPYVTAARKAGCTTLRDLCDALTARGVVTGRGKADWHPAALARVLARAA